MKLTLKYYWYCHLFILNLISNNLSADVESPLTNPICLTYLGSMIFIYNLNMLKAESILFAHLRIIKMLFRLHDVWTCNKLHDLWWRKHTAYTPSGLVTNCA